MDIRRAMPVIKTDRLAEARRFYEGFPGFRVAMDEDGMLMLGSTSTPTTQIIVVWPSGAAVDPELLSVDVSIEVADVDAAYAVAQAEALEIVRKLRAMEYPPVLRSRPSMTDDQHRQPPVGSCALPTSH